MHPYLRFAFDALYQHVVTRPRAHAGVLAAFLLLAAVYLTFFSASAPQAGGYELLIGKDTSASVVSRELADSGVIKNGLAFKALARLTGADHDFRAGKYLFTRPENAFTVLYRLTNGISEIPEIRITFPEGMSSFAMAGALAAKFPAFDARTFATLAKAHEGYLFPDTYDFYADVAPADVIDRMTTTFDAREKELADAVQASGRSLSDIVIMASIVEREANTEEDRRIVAGILWKRLDAGQALQVDAPFGYERGEDGYAPSSRDLKEDSPYNTYTNRGLTPTAIGNPGLDALRAAAEPAPTEYWYYLTGNDGIMRYAKTFEEHKKNVETYL